MPSPRRFLVASTSLPLGMGWGRDLCVYLGIFSTLFLLLLLLLWILIRQLRNSVGNGMLQPKHSARDPKSYTARLQANPSPVLFLAQVSVDLQ
ncbi:hypothetical protein JZ751_022374 [Albula glossodonta]|uniref:Uncharacterized protein n=1 Tax=Albula glossodonta TaxID=121402 RepID=A0A8T2NHY3_9TELE|nr:hypothetical protein JZ751_022374 [Albula glossodonta]